MESSNPFTRFAENIARMRANAEGPFTDAVTEQADETCTRTPGCYKLADHLGRCSTDPFEGIDDGEDW